MKKLVFILLVFGIAAQAFCQLTWRFDSNINFGLASWVLPTGEKAENSIKVGNSVLFNDLGNNPTSTYRDNFAYTSPSMDLFTSGNVNIIKSNEVRLYLYYTNQNVRFHLQTNFDNLFRMTIQGANPNELAGSHSFIQGDGNTVNWGDFLRYSFENYYVRATLGPLTLYAGNSSDRGKVSYFYNFGMDALKGSLVEFYGVLTPTANAADFQSQDANNPQRNPNAFNSNNFYYVSAPYFKVETRIDSFGFPLTIQLIADPGINTFSAEENYLRFNGMVRVSGERVANRITFDAFYKFKGGDPDTLDNYDDIDNPGGTLQPNGDGISSHVFGVFANILNVPNFGFGIGYSGYYRTFEDTLDTAGKTSTKSGPLFSGFELRIPYTGIQRTTITYHGNVSFANTDKTTDDHTAVGVWGTNNLALNNSQSWFALYNALGINFRPGSDLLLSLQTACRLGIVTTTVDPPGGGIR